MAHDVADKLTVMHDHALLLLSEDAKKDACYRQVKARYDVFPSARASQALAKCRKSKGQVHKSEKGADLKRWGREKWKDTRTGKDCGAGGDNEYCRPTKKVSSETPKTKGEMSKGELKAKKAEKKKVGMGDRVSSTSESQGFFRAALQEEHPCDGRKLRQPWRTPDGPKKFAVCVSSGSEGKRKVVRFGDPNMEIQRDDPENRKNFRSRHNCDDPGPDDKARYWSCKMWQKGKSVGDMTSESLQRQPLSFHVEDGAPVPVDWPRRVGSNPPPGVTRREAYPAGKLDRDADFGTGPDAKKLAKALAWIKPSRRAAAGGRIFKT